MAYLFAPAPGERIYGTYIDIGGNKRFAPVDAADYLRVPGSGRPIAWAMGDGLPVKTDNVPTKLQLDSVADSLPDLWMFNGYWLLSDEVRRVIERLEPNTHQFFPVDVCALGNGGVLTRRHMFNICNRIESVDYEATPLKWLNRPDGTLSLSQLASLDKGDIVIRKDAVAGCHLWRDKWLAFGGVAAHGFCSERFHEDVVSNDFSGMDFQRLREL